MGQGTVLKGGGVTDIYSIVKWKDQLMSFTKTPPPYRCYFHIEIVDIKIISIIIPNTNNNLKSEFIYKSYNLHYNIF